MDHPMCCEELKEAIKDGFVSREEASLCIRGKPRPTDDGYDPMPEEREIRFCPFCGQKILQGGL